MQKRTMVRLWVFAACLAACLLVMPVSVHSTAEHAPVPQWQPDETVQRCAESSDFTEENNNACKTWRGNGIPCGGSSCDC